MEGEDEAAVANHSAMTFLSLFICIHTKAFSFLSLSSLPPSFPFPPPPPPQEQFEFALTAVAEEVNAILKALPQWRHHTSLPTFFSLAEHRFPLPTQDWHLSLPFLLLALFLPLLSLPPPHLYIYCILMNVVPDISPGSIFTNFASEYYCWSGICVVWAIQEYLWRPIGSDVRSALLLWASLSIWNLVLYNCDVVPEHTVLVPLTRCLRDVKCGFLF